MSKSRGAEAVMSPYLEAGRDSRSAICGLRDPVSLRQSVSVPSNRKVLLLIGALFVLVVVVTGLGVWHVEGSLDNDKRNVLALADEFMDCLYREDIACLKAVSVWNEPALNESLALARQLHLQLGARGKSEPIKGNAWSMRKFSSLTSGVTTTIRVTLAASYDHDPNVREWFELIEKDGTLRLQNFRVHSQKSPAVTKLSAAGVAQPKARRDGLSTLPPVY